MLDSCRWLEQDGFEVTYLPVKPNGLVDLDAFKAALRPETVLVSIMGVNNEIGVVQVRAANQARQKLARTHVVHAA